MRSISRWPLVLVLIPMVTLAWRLPSPSSQDRMIIEASGWTALMHGIDGMHAAMASVQPSGNPDVDFVRLMLPHHQGAVDMAKVELIYGTDPQLRRLAQEIVTDQESEIQLMHLWLNKRERKQQDSR